ncbi:hypothetical protein [Ramlibacter sp. WS9]|uniref:hypothetical protein n=1 Tax=Ramlibacter sp. WS9 TaxID=1882741 RepID=UPI00116CA7BA|nr:hypothetical protein [Ramlibacter sp. WS9]ROZ62130.1 hypothetical protein EEB15_31480 [Ramlibacter sp. WS9]
MPQKDEMPAKEANARIKINGLLEAAGWRFFGSDQGKANIALEPNVKLTQAQVDVGRSATTCSIQRTEPSVSQSM